MEVVLGIAALAALATRHRHPPRNLMGALAHLPCNAPLAPAAAATAAEAKAKALAAPTATSTAIALHAQAATQRRITNAFPRKNRTVEAVRPPPNAPPAPAEAATAATATVKAAAARTATQVETATHALQAITKAHPSVTPKSLTAALARRPPNALPAPVAAATAVEAKVEARVAPTATRAATATRALLAIPNRATNASRPRNLTAAHAHRPLSVRPAPAAVEIAVEAKVEVPDVLTAIRMASAPFAPRSTP